MRNWQKDRRLLLQTRLMADEKMLNFTDDMEELDIRYFPLVPTGHGVRELVNYVYEQIKTCRTRSLQA